MRLLEDIFFFFFDESWKGRLCSSTDLSGMRTVGFFPMRKRRFSPDELRRISQRRRSDVNHLTASCDRGPKRRWERWKRGAERSHFNVFLVGKKNFIDKWRAAGQVTHPGEEFGARLLRQTTHTAPQRPERSHLNVFCFEKCWIGDTSQRESVNV